MGQHLMFVFFVLFTIIQGSKCSDVRIAIQPKETVALLDETVSISCDVDSHVEDIVLISISKDGKDPIAVIRQNSINVTYNGQEVLRYQAEGRIDKTAVRKYLTLNVSHPTEKDGGTYTCKLLYLDHFFTLEQASDSDNLTVNLHLEMQRMETILSSLLKKMTILESENKDLKDKAPSDIELIIEKVVIFTEALVNQGNDYDSTTGVFTAPRKGLYTFSLAYLMVTGSGGASISIQKNKEQLCTTYVNTAQYTHPACSTVVTLEKGDRVMCVAKEITGPHLYGGLRRSVFNGHLIKTL